MSALESAPDTIRVMHVDDEPELTDLTATYLERESDRFDVTIQPRDDEPITCENHMGVLPYECEPSRRCGHFSRLVSERGQ